MLLYADKNFIQVLEGPEEAVESVFSSIERDHHHGQVTVLQREAVPHRNFQVWSMGYEVLQSPPAFLADDLFAMGCIPEYGSPHAQA